jgi:hypothetical protein
MKLSELSLADLEALRKWMTGEFGSGAGFGLRTSYVCSIEKEIEKRIGEIDFGIPLDDL